MQGSFVEMQGSFAEIRGSVAELQGSFAEIQGSFSKVHSSFVEMWGSLALSTEDVWGYKASRYSRQLHAVDICGSTAEMHGCVSEM